MSGRPAAREASRAEGARRCHQRSAGERRHGDLDHRSGSSVTLRHPAAFDRRDDLRCDRPAAGGAVFHAAQQLSRGAGGRSAAADRSAPVQQALSHLAVTGNQVPVSSLVRLDTAKTAYLAINHQSQFPAVTVSFNLSGGAALGDAVKAIQQVETELGSPATLRGSFQGTAQAFQTSLASQPYLIAAALLVVYLILGVLYESFIHPLTILSTLSLGRGRRPPDADAVRLRSQRDRADRHHHADRHREEERHHDGGFRAERPARAQSAARGGDLPGLRAALPPDHDDDDVRDPGRSAADAGRRHRIRASPTARLCHGRRTAGEPGPDPVHHPRWSISISIA